MTKRCLRDRVKQLAEEARAEHPEAAVVLYALAGELLIDRGFRMAAVACQMAEVRLVEIKRDTAILN